LERRVLGVPSLEEMEQVLASIGEANGGRNLESLDMIEFLAFTGLRIGEARSVTWADVGREFLTVTGGAAGTKNREFRRVPMMPRVVELLNRRRGVEKPVGPVFRVKSPKNALSNACERVGIPHLRIHDLRHFFATHCIEQGVDVPTVAKWLGHKDGGVLAMKTYGHIRDDHSLAMIKKLG
jgi:integrase